MWLSDWLMAPVDRWELLLAAGLVVVVLRSVVKAGVEQWGRAAQARVEAGWTPFTRELERLKAELPTMARHAAEHVQSEKASQLKRQNAEAAQRLGILRGNENTLRAEVNSLQREKEQLQEQLKEAQHGQ